MRKTGLGFVGMALIASMMPTSSAAAQTATKYFARIKLVPTNQASAGTDQYEDVDVLAVATGPVDYRTTSAPGTIAMRCTNPVGGKCGGGGPLTTSRPVSLPVTIHRICASAQGPLDYYWPVVTPPPITSTSRPPILSVCRSYASQIDNSVTNPNGRPGLARDADGNQYDNNCMLPSFSC